MAVKQNVGMGNFAKLGEKDLILGVQNFRLLQILQHPRAEFGRLLQPGFDATRHLHIVAATSFRGSGGVNRGVGSDPIKYEIGFGEIDPVVMTAEGAGTTHADVEIMNRGGPKPAGRLPCGGRKILHDPQEIHQRHGVQKG